MISDLVLAKNKKEIITAFGRPDQGTMPLITMVKIKQTATIMSW
ncbi:MAG: hypothetical protein Q8891_02205 [Bacteroidota bacterium]|nr:hypothetical protein [Bacteroidota bacterium]